MSLSRTDCFPLRLETGHIQMAKAPADLGKCSWASSFPRNPRHRTLYYPFLLRCHQVSFLPVQTLEHPLASGWLSMVIRKETTASEMASPNFSTLNLVDPKSKHPKMSSLWSPLPPPNVRRLSSGYSSVRRPPNQRLWSSALPRSKERPALSAADNRANSMSFWEWRSLSTFSLSEHSEFTLLVNDSHESQVVICPFSPLVICFLQLISRRLPLRFACLCDSPA